MSLVLLLRGLSQRPQVMHVVALMSVAQATQRPTSYRGPFWRLLDAPYHCHLLAAVQRFTVHAYVPTR